MKYRISSCLSILAVLSLLAGCGSSASTSGDTISIRKQVKAEEGSTLTGNNNRVTLEIAPGALSEDTRISINEVDENDWSDAIKDLEPEGEVLRLEPDGLEFDKPVTITLHLDANELSDIESGEIPVYTLVSVSKDGTQEYLDDVETRISGDGSVEVNAKLSHFSWIIRKKNFLEVRLEEVEKEIEVDGTFKVYGQCRNKTPRDSGWLISTRVYLETSGAIAIPEYNWDDSFAPDYGKVTSTSNRSPSTEHESMASRAILNFTWTCIGVEPGTGVFSLIVEATERNPDLEETPNYRVVLEDTVKIVPRNYNVIESRGDYMGGMATFHWKLANRRGSPPADNLFCWLELVRLPDNFQEKYDSGEAILDMNRIEKQARDLIIPFDEDGNIRFALETQIPGEYAFRVKKIIRDDYTDDESYEGNGDEIVVQVPEPSGVSGLHREHEKIGIPMRMFDEQCFVGKWHLFDDESEIVPWSEISPVPKLTAPDGKEYSGLFLISERHTMVEGHPYLPYQHEGYTVYRWATLLRGCGQFGTNLGKCGYGEDGVLYYTVCIQPWDTITLSILDVAEEWFTYSGTGDPIVITYSSEDEPVTITYPD